MSLPDRRYWRDPQYWRWWWRERLSSGDKLLLGIAAAGVLVVGGVITADSLSYDDTSETLTVPVISTVGAPRNGDSSVPADGAPLTPPASTSPGRVVTEVLTSFVTTTSLQRRKSSRCDAMVVSWLSRSLFGRRVGR